MQKAGKPKYEVSVTESKTNHMTVEIILLRLVYAANILVAGWISITALFNPTRAVQTVFENNFA